MTESEWTVGVGDMYVDGYGSVQVIDIDEDDLTLTILYTHLFSEDCRSRSMPLYDFYQYCSTYLGDHLYIQIDGQGEGYIEL